MPIQQHLKKKPAQGPAGLSGPKPKKKPAAQLIAAAAAPEVAPPRADDANKHNYVRKWSDKFTGKQGRHWQLTALTWENREVHEKWTPQSQAQPASGPVVYMKKWSDRDLHWELTSLSWVEGQVAEVWRRAP